MHHKYDFNHKSSYEIMQFCLKDQLKMCANIVNLLEIHMQMHNFFLYIDTIHTLSHTHTLCFLYFKV